MSLRACTDCGHEMSSSASACPNCGAKPPKPTRKTSPVTLIVGAVMIVGVVGGLSHARQEQADIAQAEAQRVAVQTPVQRAAEAAAKAKAEILLTARTACEEFVTKSLHDPSSADLGDFRRYPAAETKPGIYVVQVSGRAKNGFNALRSLTVNCTVSRSATGDWTLRNLAPIT